jgi:3-oxoadipate enol-lactonase
VRVDSAGLCRLHIERSVSRVGRFVVITHFVRGQGPPLVLLNGGMMTLSAWEPLAAPLQADHTVVRLDFRGQLLSPGIPPASLDGHADDVAALLDSLGLGPADLVGTSFGSFVAMTLAAREPARARSLAVIAGTERISEAAWDDAVELREECVRAADGGDGGRVFDLLLAPTFSPAYRTAQASALSARRAAVGMLPRRWFSDLVVLLDVLRGLDLTPLLPRIACPALVVAAELDSTFPLEHSRALAAGLPHAALAVVEGAGHGVVIERPQEVVALLREFLARVGA